MCKKKKVYINVYREMDIFSLKELFQMGRSLEKILRGHFDWPTLSWAHRVNHVVFEVQRRIILCVTEWHILVDISSWIMSMATDFYELWCSAQVNRFWRVLFVSNVLMDTGYRNRSASTSLIFEMHLIASWFLVWNFKSLIIKWILFFFFCSFVINYEL